MMGLKTAVMAIAANMASLLCAADAMSDLIAVEASLPPRAEGMFVEIKTLADMDITLKSSGTWQFVKGESFTMETLKPVKSAFTAMKDGYSTTVRGITTKTLFKDIPMSAPLAALCGGDLDAAGRLFEVEEFKGGFSLTPLDPDMASIVKVIDVSGGGLGEFTSKAHKVKILYLSGDTVELVFSEP